MKKLIFMLLLAVIPALSFADLTVTTYEDGEAEISYFKANQLASYEDGELQSIIDVKNNLIILIDNEHKVYTKASFEEFLKEQEKFFQAAMQQMFKNPRTKKIYLEQKKELESQKYSYQKGGSKIINGYSCDSYTVYRNGKKYKELWVAPKLLTEVKTEFNLANMIQFSEKSSAILKKYGMEYQESKIETEIMQKGYLVFERELPEGMVFLGLRGYQQPYQTRRWAQSRSRNLM